MSYQPDRLPDTAQKAAWRVQAESVVRRSCATSLVLAVVIVGVLTALLAQGVGAARRAQQADCVRSVRRVSQALRQYALDHDNYYPATGIDWRRAVMGYVDPEAKVSQYSLPSQYWACPAVMTAVFYEMNPSLRVLGLDDIVEDKASRTVAIFESKDDIHPAYPHPGGSVYGFVDGHAECIAKGRDSTLIWGFTRIGVPGRAAPADSGEGP